MQNRKYYLPCIVVLGSILFWCKTASAQDFDNVEIKKVKVTDNIYMLKGLGGNIGVSIGEDAVFLVDDQFAPLTEKIKIAISEISDKPIDFVLNTHWHYDHTEGNEPLGEMGALIVSHDNTRKRLSEGQFIEFFKKKQSASPKIALPVVTFANSITFHLNGEEIYAFHVELAHTDGDAIVYFKRSNVVHMGDIYFAGGYPFIDVPNGGSVNGIINAVSHVLNITNEDTKFIPGHGPLSNRNELVSYKTMLVAIRDRIQAQIKQKKTLEEIIGSKPTKEFDEANKAFIPVEGFIKILYQDLSRNS